MHTHGFPDGLAGKEPACNAGDTGDTVWFLGWEDSLEEEMATHSSILALRIPMDRGAWWATAQWVIKSRTQLSDSAQNCFKFTQYSKFQCMFLFLFQDIFVLIFSILQLGLTSLIARFYWLIFSEILTTPRNLRLWQTNTKGRHRPLAPKGYQQEA